ncbi:hypothetical protein C7N43_35635 [Sphingobacteriales bacterium UPWRP_1]|nr:hypothetical protein C7N43_35635 [Sphingobacteriales bacterium UPWRP_1]
MMHLQHLFLCLLLLLLFNPFAQAQKGNVPQNTGFINIEIASCKERKIDIIIRNTSQKDADNNPNMTVLEFEIMMRVKGEEEIPMRFANDKTKIVAEQYEELLPAILRVELLKTKLSAFTGTLSRKEQGIDFDENGTYKKSVKDMLKSVLNPVYSKDTVDVLISYSAQQGKKNAACFKIGTADELTADEGEKDKFLDVSKKIRITELIWYIDIDNCTDVNKLVAALKDSVEMVQKNKGHYYFYLSDPSKKAYIADSRKKDNYEDLLEQIRRIEPGRAATEEDEETVKAQIKKIYLEVEDGDLKKENVRIVFTLPNNNKGAWPSAVDEACIKNEKDDPKQIFDPKFYNCEMEEF